MASAELQALTSAATIIQTIFFVISVLFIWYQIREHNRLTRVANTQTLVALAAPFLMQLSQDRDMAELWVNGTKNYDKMDVVDQFRYIQLLAWWLIVHENIFYQYHSGLVDEKMYYQGWQIELQEFVRRVQIGMFWEKELKRFFRVEFQQQIEKMIEFDKVSS
jgi:hypothetical protein